MNKWIVELEPGVWISTWGVTLVKESAKQYKDISAATHALAYKRRHKNYMDAKLEKLLTEDDFSVMNDINLLKTI